MKHLISCEKVKLLKLAARSNLMRLNKILKNTFLVFAACIVLSACATKKVSTGQMQGDVYTGTDTVEYLADGVADRVFFATNETVLTTASRETLRAQAAWMRKNSKINVVLEGHADERGTREYNLALGERRANAAKDYLMTYGISSDRISVLSYGKERPVDAGSNPLAWSKNRRSVTVKAN
ncbi:peptidoglycan-associated lipoprotein Pal [Pelagibacterales bacterium SAG-MED21]|nr:peptidoglycan-associated lipoprotein Pal [Pelagibacterales bacterium SAG-MED21]